ncbi:hypothetical protein [Arthrobacter sp. A2-55]|uniref:hypothetical protein n=1 Tax=Arthrobacter sp. A2-55 TaxID=2897337 RepID=UPI0021CD748B|nr:hypothetical protein [Arthrobacter sp. A2-55]MCU6480519.1 hypothetical protein [Arthrobacter sp. A2-55]
MGLMSGYPHIAYIAATDDLVGELMRAQGVPVNIQGRVNLYPTREQAEVNTRNYDAKVVPVVIDVPHGGCFRASVQASADSAAAWESEHHWFTHFGKAHDFCRQREPGFLPRITVFAPKETQYWGRNGDGEEVVVATEVEFLPQRLRILLA